MKYVWSISVHENFWKHKTNSQLNDVLHMQLIIQCILFKRNSEHSSLCPEIGKKTSIHSVASIEDLIMT